MTKERLARTVRYVTVPPVMVTALLMILYFQRPDIFRGTSELFILILLLGIVPALAYPLQEVLPHYKGRGREGQRSLAFICSLAGYFAALIWQKLCHLSNEIFLICLTYCLSVAVLTLCNKLFHIRASGHACSQTAPMIFLIYFVSWKAILPCLLLAALVVWASLTLKRHSVSDLALGAAACVLSFALSRLLIAVL